ncbi:hypothetical protein PVK06_028640 [Gossypium arboreum]|uniref:GIL1/IRKI C-terminal domain-containing protein n=1 Tax=Gossypium arboreum TaxID=29729 RepID=A0ABR0P4E7_GOSAR|nr:hypothetical protein PVK06_028640 [Gossypium arboreum]
MLSQILIQATRKRDEALMEASKLKYSMAELEKKLNKLDVYCHNLKSGLDECLAWEEVLNKGTRHFSEEFSQFCDRKMNEIVAMLGWNRAWPEPLLQAFFGASKSLCLVHLLANSVHPGLPIFRLDKGARFDSVYMEDMDGERAKKLVPSMVRILITPGFYVYGNVVKCKVICRYSNNMDSSLIDKGLTSSFP